MSKRKAEDGDIVEVNARNKVLPPHRFIGRVHSYIGKFYRVEWWFNLDMPMRLHQRNQGHPIIYDVRPDEIEEVTKPTSDEFLTHIDGLADIARNRMMRSLPPLEANNPKSVTKWLEEKRVNYIPDFDINQLVKRDIPDSADAFIVGREEFRAPAMRARTHEVPNWRRIA